MLIGDCRTVLPTLADASVQCVVTSPPYYGLRDYGTAQWDGGDPACGHVATDTVRTPWANSVPGPAGATAKNAKGRNETKEVGGHCGKCGARRIDAQIGLEPTPDLWISTMVGVFREVRRVLRDDGTVWLNIGDSYATQPAGNFGGPKRDVGPFDGYRSNIAKNTTRFAKPKDLLMMPARLALALQADGWWVRSDIIWAKPNPMPESCRDRPTSAHEHIFLLSKAARYFYDSDAVREEAINEGRVVSYDGTQKNTGHENRTYPGCKPRDIVVSGRNLRNVWNVATQAFSGSHFATMPTEIVARCVRAGTSERGCCSQCGTPWVRSIEKGLPPPTMDHRGGNRAPGSAYDGSGSVRHSNGQEFAAWKALHPDITTGWQPGCTCNAEIRPCTVLDPFSGAGTSALVADRLGRDAIGIDLSHAYVDMARARLEADCPLFADVSPPPAADPEDERMADLFAEAAE